MEWIIHYLIMGRKQRTILNGCKSNWTLVRSGVSQGTILVLTLFINYLLL